mgnify:CR=1 FL=1
MRQVTQSFRDGKISVENVPTPNCSEGSILSQTTFSLISPGTERMLLEFGKGSLITKVKSQPEKVQQVLDKVKTDGVITTYEAIKSKLETPHKAGYCNVGKVIESKCSEFCEGDRVVSNGAHADFVNAPKNLCAKIPDNVTDKEAAFTVLGAIGLHGVRLIKPTIGETFVVFGLGLIGLITVQILRANGCRVLGIDLDLKRLDLARKFGAETFQSSSDDSVVDQVKQFSQHIGVDGVIICASTQSETLISQAANMCRKRGRIILVGVVGLNIKRSDFYQNEVSFQVASSYGPGRYDQNYEINGNDYPIGYVRWTQKRNFETVLELISSKRLDVTPFIQDEFDIDDAEAAYDKIMGSKNTLAVLFNYQQKSRLVNQVINKTITLNDIKFSSGQNISFIGAGNYASRFLIPAFKKNGASLHTLVSAGGVSAAHFGRKFGFNKVSTDVKHAVSDELCNMVAIVSRHNQHAQHVLQAMKNGKHVFCEKPLCLTLAEVEEIESFHRKKPHLNVQVGFNRRYSSFVIRALELLEGSQDPRQIIITANAGEIPQEHWTQDPKVGGGRIIGEACHFLDLAQYLAQSQIKKHYVSSFRADQNKKVPDTITINLGFTNGSLATIHYLSNGHKGFSKERIEVFSSGRVIQIDNFLRFKSWGFRSDKKIRKFIQDKGQLGCVKSFLDDCQVNKEHYSSSKDMYDVSRRIIEISNSLSSEA